MKRMTPEGALMKAVEITVPLVPPSVNHYVKHTRSGRHYQTQEGLAFKRAVGLFARGQRITAKRYYVVVNVFLGKGQRGDVDNFSKCVLDGLKDAGVIHSDDAVYLLTLGKDRDAENPRTEITVAAL